MKPSWMAAPYLVRDIGINAVMRPDPLILAKTRVFVDEIAKALPPGDADAR
ncbi:hypothetical protein [Paraburkholderia sp. WP4_3_2]|uniref:hypothetical protein n=1 Tax=Paraburkholderia sp. WP4_3_2 TaxID=2587162 RepID=UPI0016143223|nr:hypothetical protein [Paraburkholderia sp. WP4_3_2]